MAVEGVAVCVYDDVDDTGELQREDNFGHENICIGLHPRSALVSWIRETTSSMWRRARG